MRAISWSQFAIHYTATLRLFSRHTSMLVIFYAKYHHHKDQHYHFVFRKILLSTPTKAKAQSLH